jgi:hypothetical protein
MESDVATERLKLKAGDLVEVRSPEEIRSSVDEGGRTDAMPFMPEMLQFCGQRFRVQSIAHKTCDNIKPWNMRKVENAVHLSGVRCDGGAHANCDAGCLIFWHENWLKKVESNLEASSELNGDVVGRQQERPSSDSGQLAQLTAFFHANTERPREPGNSEAIYSCQATDLREFTSDLPWWNLWQYVKDLQCGNLNKGLADSKSEKALELLLGMVEVFRLLLVELYNKFQSLRHGVQYPYIQGSQQPSPVLPELNLQPGEFVQVKSRQEILATLDRRNRNRGLLFDSEMLKYCGTTLRVLKRVNQIVDEKNGKILKMKSPCIILEGSACAADFHKFCPRAIYHYWREGWLRRVN